ncbi:hypothetical protein EYC80_000971 [Monilinia laxa]|uniref:Uncharacterized protein n=1 Tax=Monilinia laxa TaxID=61186 RepID=A0A5N6K7P5_MONLA|nr:hypothetical protein EYC80_000971 [Monilinia laxa]
MPPSIMNHRRKILHSSIASPPLSKESTASHLPNPIAFSPHTKALQEPSQIPSHPLTNRILHLNPIPRSIFPLDLFQMFAIPMISDQPTDQKFGAQRVSCGERQSMMHKDGVTDGLIDDSVEDVG